MITSVWKRNDQTGNEKNKVMRDGYLVDVIDNNEQISGFTISDYMHGPFILIEHPESHKPKLKETLKSIGEKDDKNFRIRSGKIKFKDIQKALKIPRFELDCQTDKRIETIDGSLLNLDELIKTTATDTFEDSLLDVLAVSSGSYTVGSGGDYATTTIFFGDISATLTGALTGTVISSITESTYAAVVKNLAGYTLRLTSDTPQYGNFLSGHTISKNYTGQTTYFTDSSGTGKICIDNLKNTVTSSGNSNMWQTEGVTTHLELYNCYFDCNGYGSYPIYLYQVGQLDMYNCIISNSTSFGYNTPASGIINLYNNVAYGNTSVGFFIQNNANTTARSCFSFSNSDNDFYKAGSATIENCADEDSTLPVGSGNKRGLTPSNEIETSKLSSNFCHPLSELVNIATGGNTNHLSANALNNIAWAIDPSIGAIQAGGATGTIVPIISNFYRRMRS